jgi:hypothetical protein
MPQQALAHEIEQFSRIRNVPSEAISAEVLNSVRHLGEKDVLEPAIREMLYDFTNTPHGPTEIADILTSRVLIRGQPAQAAFVLKGRSFSRVSSREVAHQFVRLRQVPDLHLIVLVAVGDIQDDARRDFIQAAQDGGTDYLILDTHDLARLLIAYDKICPQDGTPYDEHGRCEQGHDRDPGILITYRTAEDPRYEVLQLKDVSHAGAKRYSATILVDKHYPREVLREIIRGATEEVRASTYYRNNLVEQRWGGTPAHVVWLYLAYYPEDVRRANWIVRSQWIDPGLDTFFRPSEQKGDEQYHDIQITWNGRYEELKKLYEGYSAPKGELLKRLRPILKRMLILGDAIVERFALYQRGDVSEQEFARYVEDVEPEVTELYFASGDLPMTPDDLKDFDQTCHNIFATIHNLVLPFSDIGNDCWSTSQRDGLLDVQVRAYRREKERLRFEEDKIH